MVERTHRHERPRERRQQPASGRLLALILIPPALLAPALFLLLLPWLDAKAPYPVLLLSAVAITAAVTMAAALIATRHIRHDPTGGDHHPDGPPPDTSGTRAGATPTDVRQEAWNTNDRRMQLHLAELEIERDSALENSRAKSGLLAGLYRDLRASMQEIHDLGEHPRERDGMAGRVRELAGNGLTTLDHVRQLILTGADRLHHSLVPMDLHETIQKTIEQESAPAYKKGLELVSMIYDDVPRWVHGDPARIRRILANLLDNAIRFTHTGEVVVRAMLEDDDGRQAEIKISVTDTGMGLDENRRADIFTALQRGEPVAATLPGHAGIGLLLAQRLAAGLGGQIGMDSVPMQGSTFWFTMKCHRAAPTVETETDDTLLGREVTLYESHELSRLALAHTLKSWGMRVHEVADAAEIEDGCELLIAGLGHGEMTPEVFERLSPMLLRGKHRLLLCNSSSPHHFGHLRLDGHTHCLPKTAAPSQLRREILLALGLPLTEDRPATVTPRHEPPSGSLAGRRILVAEDNPTNRGLISTFLRNAGAAVDEAEDGEQAVSMAVRQRPDAIVMDIRMPRLNGMQAAAEIRSRNGTLARIPILGLTAHSTPGSEEEMRACGIDACLIKPLAPEELVAAVLRHMRDATLETGSEPSEPSAMDGGDNRPAIHDPAAAIRLAGGNEELARDMFRMLLDESPAQHRRILDAFEANDLERLKDEVHKLHGSAAFCGLPALKMSSHRLETAIESGGREEIHDGLRALERDLKDLHQNAGRLWPDATSTTNASA
jgi:two-component system sensor histidine kinase BarA